MPINEAYAGRETWGFYLKFLRIYAYDVYYAYIQVFKYPSLQGKIEDA